MTDDDRVEKREAQTADVEPRRSDVFETVRSSFDSAVDDVRRALLDARKQPTSK